MTVQQLKSDRPASPTSGARIESLRDWRPNVKFAAALYIPFGLFLLARATL